MPLVAAAAIVGGATLGSALIGSSAAKKASQQQAQAAQNALNFQQQVYQNNQGNLQPFISAGTGATNTLADMYGFGPNNRSGTADFSKFFPSPDYTFAYQQGLQALDQSAASRGLLLSGGQVKAAQGYGQGLASQQFGNYFTRMMSLAQLGGSAANALTGSNNQSGQQIGNSFGNIGAAQASGTIGGANAVTGAVGSGVNNLMLYSQLNKSPSSYVGGAPASAPQVGSSAGFEGLQGYAPSYPNPQGGSWFLGS